MNLILIVVSVLLLFVLVFDIVALASVQSGWFTRSSTQPALASNGAVPVRVSYEFGTLGYCDSSSQNGAAVPPPNGSPSGCHGYSSLESNRGDLPSDGALRGANRGGQAALAFCILSVLTALPALVLAVLLGIVFLDTDPFGLVGSALTVLNVVFSVLAWAIMLGMHSDGDLGSITCDLSDTELDYAFYLALFGSILALIAVPLFLFGSFGSAATRRGYTRMATDDVPSTAATQEMLVHHPPPDDGIPYTLMATEDPVGSSLDWKRL